MDASEALRRHLGHPGFRPGQEPLIRAVLDGRDALGILPTGGGKSVCYMVPALLLPGLTVVVSPLISLMADQVARAREAEIPAALLNSTLTAAERDDVVERARRRKLRLLFLAPERFHVPAFRRALDSLEVSLLAVDEAHCISAWGHDFRPAYLDLGGVAEVLGAPVLALTATATPRVRDEIAEVLALRHPRRVVESFDRPNLFWHVEKVGSDRARLRGLVDAVRTVLRRPDGSVVVYAGTRRTVEALRDRLARLGLGVGGYHAGMSVEERAAVQVGFMEGGTRVVVATNAFGMGVDKPDVRLVLHWQLPGTLEAYYQEAGRAGRDGDPAVCAAFHRRGDGRLHRNFIDRSRPPVRALRRAHRVLRGIAGAHGRLREPLSRLARRLDRPPERAASLLVALVDAGAIHPLDPLPRPEDVAGGDGWVVDLGVLSRGPEAGRARALRRAALEGLRAVRRYGDGGGCRRRTLLGYFGEPVDERCGRCDRCTERSPLFRLPGFT